MNFGLDKVIDCVEYCKAHETCEGCPSGQQLDNCDLDADVLGYLKQLRNIKTASKFKRDNSLTKTY